MNIETIQKNSAYKNDNSCCTVVALAVIAEIKFEEAQAIMADAGRKLLHGCSKSIYLPVYKKFCSIDSNAMSFYEKKTVCSYMKKEKKFLKKNTVVIETRGHIFAVKNGKIQDWMSANRRHRINKIYVIEKTFQTVNYADALARGRKIVEKSLAKLKEKKNRFTYRYYNRHESWIHDFKYTLKMLSKDGDVKIKFIRYANDAEWLDEFLSKYSEHYTIEADVKRNSRLPTVLKLL